MKLYNKIIYSILFIHSFAVLAQAEEVQHAKSNGYNPEYRVNYFEKMIAKIDINTDLDKFIIPKINSKSPYTSEFVPNETLKLRLSFDYKFLGISYSTIPYFLPGNNDDNQKGSTRVLDLSFKFFYSDQFRQEFIYKKTKGFYLTNPENKDIITVYDDLEINTTGGKLFYIVNKNFSYRAYESMTERQIKSAGSFMPSVSFYFNHVITNSPNASGTYLSNIKSRDTYLQIGYMYNWVLSKKWFATFGVHPGIGLNNVTNYYTQTTNSGNTYAKNSKNINASLDANFGIGYNNETFFYGIKSSYRDFFYKNSKTIEISNTQTSFAVFMGYRFKAPKKIKKGFEYLEKKFNL